MRRNILAAVLAAVVITVTGSAAQALSVGSPGNVLELGASSLSGSFSFTELDVEDVEVDTKSIMFKGAVGATDSLTPYLKIGFADVESGSLGFAWGGGALFELVTPGDPSGLSVAVDLQVLWWDSDDGNINYDAFEGQASLMGSIRSGGTKGYAGVAVSTIDLEGGNLNLDESASTHLFFGLDYLIDFNFYLNVEAHLFGQDSLTIGFGYLF